MLDPAVVQSLQHAFVPPAFDPPAIYREWTSDAAFRVERILEPWISAQEQSVDAWQKQNLEIVSYLDKRDSEWTENELDQLDEVITLGVGSVAAIEAWNGNFAHQAAATQRQIKRVDPSAARIHQRFTDRANELQRVKVRSMKHLTDGLRRYRARVEIRTGAASDFNPAPWAPNGNTIAAMQDARAGRGLRRITSIKDLMATLDAEGD